MTKDLAIPRRLLPAALIVALSVLPVSGVSAAQADPEAVREAAMAPDSHWITRDLILLPEKRPEGTPVLVSFSEGVMTGAGAVTVARLENGAEVPEALAARFPHLDGRDAFSVIAGEADARAMTRGHLLVLFLDDDGAVAGRSDVQFPGVLDDLYTSGDDDADEVTDYGAVVTEDAVTFTLWAPTAERVSVVLRDDEGDEERRLRMSFDAASGVWRASAPRAAEGARYRYALTLAHPGTGRIETYEVTDPYSLGLTADSEYSVVLDLGDEALKPAGWEGHEVPEVAAPEDLIIYETHVGDFSGTDESVSVEKRGTYAAFLETDSDGVNHLKALKEAGLNVIHLLPVFDIGTVPEQPGRALTLEDTVSRACDLIDGDLVFCEDRKDGQPKTEQTLRELLSAYDPRTGDAQAVIEAIDEVDDYNWGYDPVHYTVPEGSYATDPGAAARVREFRAMVQRLHEMGFRVVMDVVYNHTHRAGLADRSVLDRIVPGYYHRLNPDTGDIEQSTCCENTATEHVMMAKLMTDSLVTWSAAYGIDGFRFDLMGHQPLDAMLAAREAVRAVDPDTYFYGEGWNFGEVADNARFRQATQMELPGTEIGTFTDRLRDAVRGGSSFVVGEELRRGQGIGNGLYVYANDLLVDEDTEQQYRLYADQVRIGLAGNLAGYPIVNADGRTVFGRDIPYGNAPTGYAADPADTINYVSKHDNQTLWDNNQYRIPYAAPLATRVRMQVQGLSYPLMAQGIPFLHMGGEFLRSKSFTRDSFNYGHWFNAVDFAQETNNYDVGLPPKVKDGGSWDMILTLLEKNEGRDMADPQAIALASGMFRDLLAIRSGSPLFRLRTADDIRARVSFLNDGPDMQPGAIVMALDDGFSDDTLEDLDPAARQIVVVFNHGPEAMTVAVPEAEGLSLHRRHGEGTDPIVKGATASPAGLTIPGFTTAVFVRPQ